MVASTVSLLALTATGSAVAHPPTEGDFYFGAHYSMGSFEVDEDFTSEEQVNGDTITLSLDSDFDVGLAIARLGYYIHPRIAIEGRFGFGISEGSTSDTYAFTVDQGLGLAPGETIQASGEIGLEVEIDTLLGGYLVGELIQHERLSVYAIGGLTRIEGDATASFEETATGYDANGNVFASESVSEEESESFDDISISYGAGINVRLTDDLTLNAEWMKYQTNAEEDDTEWDLEAYSIGLTRVF